jgi:hypothetical protein
MENQDINEKLMEAVERFNWQAVKECLDLGANPNYCRFKDEDSPNGLMQPTTPLRMVMFRISDCDLTDQNLVQFREIARLLTEYGADPKPAMQIAEARYGKYNSNEPLSPFMEVWQIVAGSM